MFVYTQQLRVVQVLIKKKKIVSELQNSLLFLWHFLNKINASQL
jgi:hypothetical protein